MPVMSYPYLTRMIYAWMCALIHGESQRNVGVDVK